MSHKDFNGLQAPQLLSSSSPVAKKQSSHKLRHALKHARYLNHSSKRTLKHALELHEDNQVLLEKESSPNFQDWLSKQPGVNKTSLKYNKSLGSWISKESKPKKRFPPYFTYKGSKTTPEEAKALQQMKQSQKRFFHENMHSFLNEVAHNPMIQRFKQKQAKRAANTRQRTYKYRQ
ncbi:MPN143 family protein [Mycoplasmoides pneumoniae]|uniref:MPN143 family protein n=1 Tax=Mycoplasmoides pneumoniae TaxID=2104 RepID=UPI0013302003|nr:hypothetical protein [Mycoplasmoides pneumoniae]